MYGILAVMLKKHFQKESMIMTFVFYGIFFFALTIIATWHVGRHSDDHVAEKWLYGLSLVMAFVGVALIAVLGYLQKKKGDGFRFIAYAAVPVYYFLCGTILESLLKGKRTTLNAVRMPAVIAWAVSAVLPLALPVLTMKTSLENGFAGVEGIDSESQKVSFFLLGKFMRTEFCPKTVSYLSVLVPLVVIPLLAAVLNLIVSDRHYIWLNIALAGAHISGLCFYYMKVSALDNAAEEISVSTGLGFLLIFLPMSVFCAMLSVLTGFYTYEYRRAQASEPVLMQEGAM